MEITKKVLQAITAFVLIFTGAYAQHNSPVEYMAALNNDQIKISEQYLAYSSSIAHDKSARKVEKTRKNLIKSVEKARDNAKKLGLYKDDNSLSDAFLEYYNISYNILMNDYAKLVDMEEIAEQSYDDMEAYMLAQEKANEKMSEASENMNVVYLAFAANHNIKIIDQRTVLNQKLKLVSDVNAYYNKLYLIFFKSFNQNRYLQKAINEKEINGIEQNKNALSKYSEEGIEKLNGMKSFKNDKSVLESSKKLLQFYRSMCEKNIPVVVEYLMEKEKFEEVKKAFDSKSQKSKDDMDKYNEAVNKMNQVNNKYNQTVQEMNQSVQLTDKYNSTVKTFFNKHIPR